MEKKITLMKKTNTVHSPLPWIQTFEGEYLVQQAASLLRQWDLWDASLPVLPSRPLLYLRTGWPSDRRVDSSISYRSRTGQSRPFTFPGNELSFWRQPRFPQDELKSLVTRWNGLSKSAFTLEDPWSPLEMEHVSPISNLPCQPLGVPLAEDRNTNWEGESNFLGSKVSREHASSSAT